MPVCTICGEEVENSQFSMYGHLLERHPIELFHNLAESKKIEPLFQITAGLAYHVGEQLGKSFRRKITHGKESSASNG